MTFHFTQLRIFAARTRCNVQTNRFNWTETSKSTWETVIVSNIRNKRCMRQTYFEIIAIYKEHLEYASVADHTAGRSARILWSFIVGSGKFRRSVNYEQCCILLKDFMQKLQYDAMYFHLGKNRNASASFHDDNFKQLPARPTCGNDQSGQKGFLSRNRHYWDHSTLNTNDYMTVSVTLAQPPKNH